MILLEDLLRGAASQGARVAGSTIAREFEGFAHDSRNVLGGEIFIAVRTDRADGHDHISDAVARGAAGVLCEHLPQDSESALRGVTVITCSDTRDALRAWAGYVLARQGPFVIAVTGSVGKTSTTRAIATVLRALEGDPRAVFENDNFNDLFGLPISLSRLEPAHQVAVLELATDSSGEIRQLCDLVEPHWGVITNVAPAHLEHFGTSERLAREYGALASAARHGLFLNADDLQSASLAALAEPSNAPITWFGLEAGVAVGAHEKLGVWGTDVSPHPKGVKLTLHWRDESAPVALRLPGRHSSYTALAAAAVALARGHALPSVAGALEMLTPVPGRLNPLPLTGGGLLLDDSFSASLPSVLTAATTLASSGRHRLLVLGGVSGLSDLSLVSQEVANAAHRVIVVGDQGESVLRAA
ncbi:MAG TPA: UDP-N-acetylmuramoyl-tripeptide--D-alanyl-D-alanine ligase, partial [Chloroflexota bacterium]|nr:UDP-N-acetylmuramoyl-tripeptide--D-alanyl-D-alanine ligase [Chloroflexota bacterium]